MKMPSTCFMIAFASAWLWALPAAHADAACDDKAQTQAQLSACSAADLKQADDRLNQHYKQLQERLRSDAVVRKQWLDSQRKWLAFRDAECALKENTAHQRQQSAA